MFLRIFESFDDKNKINGKRYSHVFRSYWHRKVRKNLGA